MSEPPKRKRRWFQFSLRTLIVSTIVIAAAAGWVGKRIEEKRAERVAVAAIAKLGGRVLYDFQKDGASRGPAWLRNILGDDFFGNVVELDLSESAVTDEDLAFLDGLRSLESLNISDTGVTDAGLRRVGRLQNLKSL
ncbi:MAG TPA: hypothetical protein VGH32_09420, partial [Pirellulales bacterium]